MLYLPARLPGFARREDNYRLYKALTAHAWAQTRYGSFRLPQNELLSAHFAAFPDPDKAQRLFHALETARLDARLLRATCPGFIATCRSCKRWPVTGRRRRVGHWRPSGGEKPTPVCPTSPALMVELYAGELPAPRAATKAVVRRTRREDIARAVARARRTPCGEALAHSRQGNDRQDRRPDTPSRFKIEHKPDATQPAGARVTLTLDGQPAALPADMRALMDSILQDLGQIPDEYLVAAGDGGYRRENTDAKRPEDVWKGTLTTKKARFDNEWDHKRAYHRKALARAARARCASDA